VSLLWAHFEEIETMMSVARLQAYLRHSAQQQYEAVSVPFFTLFFHLPIPLPTSTMPFQKSRALEI